MVVLDKPFPSAEEPILLVWAISRLSRGGMQREIKSADSLTRPLDLAVSSDVAAF